MPSLAPYALGYAYENSSVGIILTGDLTLSGNISGNTIRGNGFGIGCDTGYGIGYYTGLGETTSNLFGPAPPHFTGTISGNEISENEQVGIFLHSADFTGQIRNNTISGNGDYGIVGRYDAGQFNGEIVGNTIADSGCRGIDFVYKTGDINHRMVVRDNQFSGNGSNFSPSYTAGPNSLAIAIGQLSTSGALYPDLTGNVPSGQPRIAGVGNQPQQLRTGAGPASVARPTKASSMPTLVTTRGRSERSACWAPCPAPGPTGRSEPAWGRRLSWKPPQASSLPSAGARTKPTCPAVKRLSQIRACFKNLGRLMVPAERSEESGLFWGRRDPSLRSG